MTIIKNQYEVALTNYQKALNNRETLLSLNEKIKKAEKFDTPEYHLKKFASFALQQIRTVKGDIESGYYIREPVLMRGGSAQKAYAKAIANIAFMANQYSISKEDLSEVFNNSEIKEIHHTRKDPMIDTFKKTLPTIEKDIARKREYLRINKNCQSYKNNSQHEKDYTEIEILERNSINILNRLNYQRTKLLENGLPPNEETIEKAKMDLDNAQKMFDFENKQCGKVKELVDEINQKIDVYDLNLMAKVTAGKDEGKPLTASDKYDKELQSEGRVYRHEVHAKTHMVFKDLKQEINDGYVKYVTTLMANGLQEEKSKAFQEFSNLVDRAFNKVINHSVIKESSGTWAQVKKGLNNIWRDTLGSDDLVDESKTSRQKFAESTSNHIKSKLSELKSQLSDVKEQNSEQNDNVSTKLGGS